ncbi:MAG TPA: DUF5107 domain-containing protein, partial [Verrucomicrobiae bacterium]|nr:DUF5107 domain-containing protein [Verrucomicrobiae bacterium]
MDQFVRTTVMPMERSRPAATPQDSDSSEVRVWKEEVVIPTYLPAAPDKNPMFLEKRVYQGSSGKIYPLPFTDRIAETKTSRKWQAVWLENKYLRVMILPEIGGRIHIAQDKTNGYDFIYRQNVIKPALVGLAGPWISGGIEFNWPQHHRPTTFMPVDVEIVRDADGSVTVWCGEHDPMARMKGMHGVCLHAARAYLEVKARVYNRTPLPQTFLWWANAATRVHEAYQSFFPEDVHFVADHAKRAMSEYPLCKGSYYGVNYGERAGRGTPPHEAPTQFVPPHLNPRARAINNGGAQPAVPNYPANDLSFYANISTPCSYMCMGSRQDFFGGYDYAREAGVVHVANHHISPGKKQWTWGNHEFGYAWDRNLTDADGPYIELMAGVYTDNQPDFSFLQPGETKTWSQYWYPIQKIGPASHANLDASARLGCAGKTIQLGVSVSREFASARIQLEWKGRALAEWMADLLPGKPFVAEHAAGKAFRATDLKLRVISETGEDIISYAPARPVREETPAAATEPPPPTEIRGNDELFITGLHLEQYRHATRCPTLYWREALRRDPMDSRCNNALGLWHLRRGEFGDAEKCFRNAIGRLTLRNPNPSDGAPFYNLGLCLRFRLDAEPGSAVRDGQEFEAAYAAFYKATWNEAWRAAGYHSLAEMDCRRGNWAAALAHLEQSLRCNTENLRARNLKALVLRALNRADEAARILQETLQLDPLDFWARHLSGEPLQS